MDARTPIVTAHGDVRGTQSFVGIMAATLKRPSLTALEVAWRWAAGVPTLAGITVALTRTWARVPDATKAFNPGALTLTDPLGSVARLGDLLSAFLPALVHRFWWMVPIAVLLWLAAATVGRHAVLVRLDPGLHANRRALLALNVYRLVAVGVLCAAGYATLLVDAHLTIVRPLLRGAEPNLVLYFALAVSATLVLFVAWSALSVPLRLAPILAMTGNLSATEALRRAASAGQVRPKLLEINLVMGIVKIALIVLAMVFSATPLPFQSVATMQFLLTWWAAVTLLYIVASDLFHVVHTASFLTLWRALRSDSQS